MAAGIDGGVGPMGSGFAPIQIGQRREREECEGRVGDREESGAVRVSVGWTGVVSRLGRRVGWPGCQANWAVARQGGFLLLLIFLFVVFFRFS